MRWLLIVKSGSSCSIMEFYAEQEVRREAAFYFAYGYEVTVMDLYNDLQLDLADIRGN